MTAPATTQLAAAIAALSLLEQGIVEKAGESDITFQDVINLSTELNNQDSSIEIVGTRKASGILVSLWHRGFLAAIKDTTPVKYRTPASAAEAGMEVKTAEDAAEADKQGVTTSELVGEEPGGVKAPAPSEQVEEEEF